MAFRRMSAQNLTGSSHFEALGYGFLRLTIHTTEGTEHGVVGTYKFGQSTQQVTIILFVNALISGLSVV